MNQFISWSGPTSRDVAIALRGWLPKVLSTSEPWLSDEDIRKGTTWITELRKELEKSHAGIVCVTRENLSSPWLLFESGALSKTLDRHLVCPYLFGIQYHD